ncbi:16S rRNA (cytosine(1402)-N(4))-methyltransferase RsmH [Paenactinomyces guangxiensis]|uniref:Ribosomal RNA small subunit methyltransferase H n=1 Tax=Paenactinomyces guangxiensis TaxID=1490290 RepID=A0A7W2A839_9BACL|nr:16S rRNA (cytosine(1402)-N(4))-methyltransferase RsmH [Paenactinomyces guangxiensis]MBA4494255.1 16S rRNA (cytosine(1402)-N(4))-methyltransferase RsmH [Paenactinomyces guangxiensis]MBH8590751.1 16S rRNA (cytosine(1402)-N(4))-methyltransferase RsmH [Paenactinomyces guangxiensis]
MFIHETVLREEAADALHIKPDGVYLDCTLGGAGHSRYIAERLSKAGTLIGLDQDQTALDHAKERLKDLDCNLYLIKANFRKVKQVVEELGFQKVDGILFDLGVSSPQLDHGERGFSYHQDAPLDMRMDVDQELSAYEIINHWPEEELARILFEYGEEKFSRRIAKEIVKQREEEPITTTLQLVEVIKHAIPAPARRTGPHPARRSFQAIRIAVNDELNAFRCALEQSVEILQPQGRISVITFHSLEDRICKKFFQEQAQECICPPHFPVCTCQHKATLRVITKKPILPTDREIERNQRARSAKLRVAEKI